MDDWPTPRARPSRGGDAERSARLRRLLFPVAMLLVGLCIGLGLAVAPILIGANPRPVDGLTEGGDARAVAATAKPRADAKASPRVAPAPQTETDRLARSARRQIAEGRFDAPRGDNALETWRAMVAAAPDSPETEKLGSELSALFWHAANEARLAQRPADALRFFEHLKELPFVPIEALKRTIGAAPPPAETTPPPVASAPASAPAAAAAAVPTAKASPAKVDLPVGAPADAPVEGEVARVAMARGRQLLGAGDILGARRYFELAAARNSAAGAIALAATYDARFLREAGAPPDLADPDAARRWYTEAARRGAPEAKALLERMSTTTAPERLDPTLKAPSPKRTP